jgi:hypothetical protein
VKFLSDLLRNRPGGGWALLERDSEVEALAGCLETVLAPFLGGQGAALLPLVALRAEELVVAWLIARRMEDILRAEGVCTLQVVEGELRFKEIHPMVEKSMKARERVRKALQELEEACKATAVSGGSGALGDEVGPLLRLGEGVLEDALNFEKRKQKRRRSSRAANA